MKHLWKALILLTMIILNPMIGIAAEPGLYSAAAIVTGRSEENRQIGLGQCLDHVLVKVSGDLRLPARPKTAAFKRRAAEFVASFS